MCDSWINYYNGRGRVTLDSKGIFGIQDLTKKYSAGFGKTQAILTEKKDFTATREAGLAKI